MTTPTVHNSWASFATLLYHMFATIVTLAVNIAPLLQVALLVLSIILTLRSLRKPSTPSNPNGIGNGRMLNMAGGFLLIALLFCGCAAMDRVLLSPDGTPKPSLTGTLNGLQTANTLTAPVDPYAGLIGVVLGMLSSGIGWYAHIRNKNQLLDAQTQHIATLNANVPASVRASASRVAKAPTVTQSCLP